MLLDGEAYVICSTHYLAMMWLSISNKISFSVSNPAASIQNVVLCQFEHDVEPRRYRRYG